MNMYLERLFTCEGEVLTTEDISSVISLATSKPISEGGLGFPLTISSLRHLVAALQKSPWVYPLLAKYLACPDFLADNQAGHSSAVAEQHYGVSVHRLQHIVMRDVAGFVGISVEWQIYLHIRIDPVDMARLAPYLEQPLILPTNLEANEGSFGLPPISSQMTSTDLDQLSTLVSSKLQSVIVTSSRNSAAEVAALFKSSLENNKPSNPEDCVKDVHVPVQLLSTLRFLTSDPLAHFRSSEQAVAAQYVIERKGHLLVILPTSGGKSMVYLLPMLHERLRDCHVVNLIITPYRSLRQETRQRCLDVGLLAIEYHPSLSFADARGLDVVVCVADSVADPNFHSLLRTLHGLGCLGRIFIDEVHHAIFSNVFRPVFDLLYTLRQYVVEMILLSANMPPHCVPELQRSLGISNLPVIRRPTSRPEIYLAVTPLPEFEPTVFFHRWVQYYVSHMQSSGKMMIFCSTIADAAHLSTVIPSSVVYHSQLSEHEQQISMHSFRNSGSASAIMICTSALSNGIDIPNVHVVLHFGTPRSIPDFMQESGRASRDGQYGVSHVFPWHDTSFVMNPTDQGSPSFDDDKIQQWVSDQQSCRRMLLAVENDSVSVTCSSLPHAVLCDVCEAQYNLSSNFVTLPPPFSQSLSYFHLETEQTQSTNTSLDTNSVAAESSPPSLPPPLPPVAYIPLPSEAPTPTHDTSSQHTLGPSMQLLVDQHQHVIEIGREQHEQHLLKEILNALQSQGLCIACWAHGLQAPKHLRAFDCIEPHFFKGNFSSFRNQLKIPIQHCFFCAIPQVS